MAAGRAPLAQRARSGAADPFPRSKFQGQGFPKLPPSAAPWSLNLSLGGKVGGARWAQPSGLGQASGSPEKGPIHSLPEGHNLGGSWYGREEPASSTPALPFNPSQTGPEGKTVWARPGPTAAPRPLGLRRIPLLGSVAVQQIRGPMEKTPKRRGAHQHAFEGLVGCFTLSAKEPEALPPLGAVRGQG